MYHRRRLLLFLVALIAPSTHASLIPRQDTSSATSASTTEATSTSNTPTPTTSISTTATTSASSVAPFVSVEKSGVLTTVTPTGAASATASASPSAEGNNTTSAPACTKPDYALGGEAAPFCLPANGSAWIQNTSYPVTWNPDFWPGYKGSVVIALMYNGADGSNVITQNNEIANQRGFFNIDVDSSWLNGNTIVSARLLIAPNEATTSNGGAHFGPIVSLQNSANPMDTSPPKWNGKNLAVVIAVPVSVVVIAAFLFGVCYFTRKHRKLPDGLLIPRNGGRKSKRGYAEGRSRRKRTVGVEKTDDEFELGTVSGYRDEPVQGYTDFPEPTERGAHH